MSEETPHRRRPRYSGKNPRRFEDKYKELDPAKHAETIAKVLASGKTPAGSHVPIMVKEILDVLDPKPGERATDCTLGHGGHSRAILQRIAPGGCLMRAGFGNSVLGGRPDSAMGRSGISNEKVEPLPGEDASTIRPLISPTRRLQIMRPRPEPP